MIAFHEPIEDHVRDALKEYDDLTAALLSRRGIRTKEEADAFLSPSYDAHIGDPLLIMNMRKAAERIAGAIERKERITVWSDYDCDGIPGGVILHDFLKKAGANFDNYIPHRHEEGFGVNIPGVEMLAREGTKVMITVDCGITDVEPIRRAQELGIDVILTGHTHDALPLPVKVGDTVSYRVGGSLEGFPFVGTLIEVHADFVLIAGDPNEPEKLYRGTRESRPEDGRRGEAGKVECRSVREAEFSGQAAHSPPAPILSIQKRDSTGRIIFILIFQKIIKSPKTSSLSALKGM